MENDVLTREQLSLRYGVDSEFVRVKTLAKIIGLAPATIYTHIREDSFPIPFRHLGGAPMVRVDDLLRWMNEDEAGFVIGALSEKLPVAEASGTLDPIDSVQSAIDRAMAKVAHSRARRARRA